MMHIDILSGFPDMFRGPLTESIVQRAMVANAVEIWVHDLRHFTTDRHGKIDDIPYGGGAGMVLMAQPVFACLDSLRDSRGESTQTRRVFLTPQGKRLTQDLVDDFARCDHLVLLCGHYKDVDDRVFARDNWEEISIGDFVLSGGELVAALLVDAVVRRLPGVLGDEASAGSDSFADGLLDCPYFTKPEEIEGLRVPEVLLSGHHAKIAAWRSEQKLLRTKSKRPDLLERRGDSN